jgi:putative ABC transport system substrate-binding protein
MRRRDFITLLGGTAAWPLAARAQQGAMPTVGFLSSYSPNPLAQRLLAAFRQGLADTGYLDGSNVAIEPRWADGQYDRLPALADDLVRRRVAVIAATAGDASAVAARAASATIPIVFQTAGDPVATGLARSLNQPGGNVTGVTSLNSELGPKRLELLHEMVPAATTFAMLLNPANPNNPNGLQIPPLAALAAERLGLNLRVVQAGKESDFDAAFSNLAEMRAEALFINVDAFFISQIEQLAALTVRQRVPATYAYREFAAAGGLMSYGGSLAESYRAVGNQVGRVLSGQKPGDLPVQQVTKVELVVNLKTAKALGITVPLALLTRADEVIE